MVKPIPANSTILSAASGSGTYGGTAAFTAKLTLGGSPLAGDIVSFTLDEAGTVMAVGTATTNASGVASLSGVNLSGVDAGTYFSAVGVTYAGNSTYAASSASGSLTVNRGTAILTLSGLSFTYDGTPHTATVSTEPAGLTGVTITYVQNQVAVPAPTQAGSYSVMATLNSPNYTAPSVTGILVINRSESTPTPTPTTPTPTPTAPTPTPTARVIIGEQAIFQRKRKKGKPTGKAVLTGFALEFSVSLDTVAAANFQVDTFTTKKVKKKKATILHPITKFSVSYLAASDDVELMLGTAETFPSGGQLTVLGGIPTAAGATLTGPAVFTIASGGKSVGPP